ncbi:STAS domain-containing protein [Lignipirellula cremea]|uniref:STAS domain protein n=1 Tax=Lignipirellula cremea TaxID=2528010 RepID=A0A518DWV1_9BACT|nr:STAS domain-containing protein [Lignipirellula cremea]QDU96294.1 STAS domain protein [Lignipirellula cremea]
MQLPTEIFGNVIVVHTPEEVGDEQSDALENFLTSLERTKVIVDLDGTETFDSSGLTSLLNAKDILVECGGDLKISSTQGVNRKILEITRIDKRLEVFDSVIDAVKSFV